MALRSSSLSTEQLGQVGERLAERHLRRRGWRVLARRLHTRAAEIDLVVGRAQQLVCVEVKTGRVPFRELPSGEREPVWEWRPGRRATRQQLARLRRAARELRASRCSHVRVDLVEVLVDRGGTRVAILHHPDCRLPPLVADGKFSAGELHRPSVR